MSKCLIEAAMTVSFQNNQWFLKFFVLGFCFDQTSVCLRNAYFIFSSFLEKNLILLQANGNKRESMVDALKIPCHLGENQLVKRH
jgi:hypothetical protein